MPFRIFDAVTGESLRLNDVRQSARGTVTLIEVLSPRSELASGDGLFVVQFAGDTDYEDLRWSELEAKLGIRVVP